MTPVGWDGFANARDLGGLALRDGGTTATGRLFRSATLRFVTARGWEQAWDAGVRTVVDLRNDDEVDPASGPPPGFARVRFPLDDVGDVALWRTIRSEGLDGSPLYFPLFTARKPERCAGAVRAVVGARPGGVLFHCGVGRDRTGLLALLLLSLAGATTEAVAADYTASAQALPALFAGCGVPDQGPAIEEMLRARGTTPHGAIADAVRRIDVGAVLRDGGLGDDEITAARALLR